MGYLISGLFLKECPNASALRDALPPSIGFNLYHHPQLDIYAIDAFRPSKPNAYPLTSPIPSVDLPLELGPHLQTVTAAYNVAVTGHVADGFKRSYVNLAESLSAKLGQSILAVYTNDDYADFACIASQGALVQMTALCGEQIIRFSHSTIETVEPDDERQLHQGAAKLFAQFTNGAPEIFGFGAWDPPENYGLVPAGT